MIKEQSGYTKEDAEFVLKYHTTKTLKFEPPTWKEFLATKKHEDMFAHWCCGDICVVMVEENNEKGILKTYNQFEVDVFNDYDSKSRKLDYCIIQSCGIDTREETYYKALEYAKKLFLEEEEWKTNQYWSSMLKKRKDIERKKG